MNKKKLARNVSLVALSAVMVAGTATAFAGCGGGSGERLGDPYVITVNIFCDETDKATNEQICNTWAKQYDEELHVSKVLDETQHISVDFKSTSDDDGYFKTLNDDFVRDKAADIIYVRPRSIKSWAQRGRILNLADFVKNTNEAVYQSNKENIQGLWPDVLAFYGYDEAAEKAGTYAAGDALQYYGVNDTLPDGTQVATQEQGGFYTDNGTKVGVYGLPKDYSNFSMGYNARYFSDALKYAYQTVLPGEDREVVGALNYPKQGPDGKTTYTGESDEAIVTYAVDGTKTVHNPFSGEDEEISFKAGEPAPLINIGVPVYYRPYNFYMFHSYADAVSGNDPVAKSVTEFAGEEKGYLVTLPGFPGDTFAVPDSWTNEKGVTVTKGADADAPYDANIGHITFTYAEFGALTWAVTYFCNTFNFRAIQDALTWDQFDGYLEGTSGVLRMDNSTPENVYGNDQYEGDPNATLYLLPWLAGNDANFINTSSDVAINAKKTDSMKADASVNDNEYDFSDGGISFKRREITDQNTKGGTITEKVAKLRLSGEREEVDVQYGVNSASFIETYGAFLAYGSDWNGNSGNAGSENKVKDANGWNLFRHGACIFYGAGTWDNKTKNESPVRTTINGKEETFCEFRTMTIPVGEKYSLASYVKDAFYQMQPYGAVDANGNVTHEGVYSTQDIINNQMLRQDKWGARMDSVGFAINSQVQKLSQKNENAAWKLQGAADLILTLTADHKAQHDLTLGGAQLPNFQQDTIEFAKYQDEQYAAGTFADMITPEGFATTKYWNKPGIEVNPEGVKEADAIWSAYLSVVEKLNNASETGKADLELTFSAWFQTNYKNNVIPAADYKLSDGTQGTKDIELKWDDQYANMKLKDVLTGEFARRAAAMKVLKMTTYTYADRDLQLRMQYGMNAVRDSAMYTYDIAWINAISMRDSKGWTYRNQGIVETNTISELLAMKPSDPNTRTFYTPAYFCFDVAETVQRLLEQSMRDEANSLSK